MFWAPASTCDIKSEHDEQHNDWAFSWNSDTHAKLDQVMVLCNVKCDYPCLGFILVFSLYWSEW